MGFDEWAKIYTRYVVVSAKITMRPLVTGISNTVPGFYGVAIEDSIGALYAIYGGSVPTLLESKQVGRNYAIAGSSDTPALRVRPISKNISIKKYFGVEDLTSNTELGAAVTANPTEQSYFTCWVGSVAANDPATQYFVVTIDYIAIFHEPLVMSGS